MSVKLCTSEGMLSTVRGLGFSRAFFPRIVAEAFLESTKDGEIKRSPDPVTMIDGDLSWTNNTADPQFVFVQVIRAARSIVAQSPGTVVITDATSHAVGASPTADFPSVWQDTCGGKLQTNRSSTAAADLGYCRQFYDFDSSQAWVTVGRVDPMEALHFRYLSAVQTPGVWTTPSEFEPRWEAHARYARLIAIATPIGDVT
ncbi:hypothetical protein B1R94_02380 [Mycolicibacterium litorale]|nr:hypothetical protein B1R94_02380 [Mycolicibacterium litorale]